MASGLSERDQIYKREDVLDVITRVDEKSTPFSSRVRKGQTPHNTYMQWTVDLYDTPSLGGVVDGSDVTSFENHAKDRAILSTYLQTHRRTAKVTPLAQEVSDVAGLKGDELSEAVSKKLVEIARDIEATLLSDQEHQVDDGSNEYLMRGLGTWILDTTNIAGQTLLPVPAAYRPAAAQIVTTATASLTESDIQTPLKSIYDATGMSGSYTWVCGSTLRRQITDMTRFSQFGSTNTPSASREFTFPGTSNRVTETVSFYEGDYGSVEVISSNFIGSAAGTFAEDQGRGYILDMDKIVLRSHKQPTVHPLSNEGGGERAYIEARCALEVLNPIGLVQFNTALS